MIVERWAFGTKDGCWGKMIELLKTRREQSERRFEILTCRFGAHNAQIVTELRFESMAEMEKFWDGFGSTPEERDFLEKFQAFGSDSTWANHEVWNVIE